MSPASSASSLRPTLARTSLVRGNVTRRSPIAVSPRIVPMVILGRSLTGGSTFVGGRMTCMDEAGGLFGSAFFGAVLVFTCFAGLVFLLSFLVAFLWTPRFFAAMRTLAYLR